MRRSDAAGRGAIRLANAACGFALPVYLIALVAGRPFAQGSLAPGMLRDYGYAYQLSRHVEATQRYDWFFAYPPPNVVLRLGLADLGWELSAVLWMAGLVVSGLLSVILALRLLGLDRDPKRYLVAALGVAMTSYFIEWDLRFISANFILLALVLGFLWCLWRSDEAPWLAWPAGFLLATGVALKLYPALFLGYLVLIRRFRALGAALASLALLFVALPWARFGFHGFLAVTGSWLDVVVGLWSPASVEQLVAYKVSPQAALAALRGTRLGEPGSQLTVVLTRAVQAAWLLGVAAYFAPRFRSFLRRGPLSPIPGDALVADASVLLLAPLPLSPLLQPHHLVLVLLPSMLVARWCLSAATPTRLRLGLAALCAGIFAASHYTPAGPLKGIPVFLILALLLVLVALHGRAHRAPAAAALREAHAT